MLSDPILDLIPKVSEETKRPAASAATTIWESRCTGRPSAQRSRTADPGGLRGDGVSDGDVSGHDAALPRGRARRRITNDDQQAMHRLFQAKAQSRVNVRSRKQS